LKREEEKMVFDAQGALRAAYQGKDFNNTLTVNAQFNSLMQLGGLVAVIKNSSVEIVFGLQNISPISVILRVKQPGRTELRRETEIPGPLLLRRTRGEAYTLEYPRMKAMRADGLLAQAGFLKAYDLRLLPAESPGVDCSAKSGALDVTAAVSLLQRFAGQAGQLLKVHMGELR